MKELRLTANTADHDLQTKAKQADKFLVKDRESVRFNVMLRGRLIDRPELAYEVLNKIIGMLTNMGSKTAYSLKGNIVSCTVNPKKL
jgi:translation initiation factor IF-3